MNPIQSPYPKWYDSNARCDYHIGGARHSTENCLALKRNVQSLINDRWLSFKKVGEKSDVNNNPLPNHENPKVSVVDCFVEKCKNEGETVYACPPDFELNTWDVVDIPTFSKEFQE